MIDHIGLAFFAHLLFEGAKALWNRIRSIKFPRVHLGLVEVQVVEETERRTVEVTKTRTISRQLKYPTGLRLPHEKAGVEDK